MQNLEKKIQKWGLVAISVLLALYIAVAPSWKYVGSLLELCAFVVLAVLIWAFLDACIYTTIGDGIKYVKEQRAKERAEKEREDGEKK